MPRSRARIVRFYKSTENFGGGGTNSGDDSEDEETGLSTIKAPDFTMWREDSDEDMDLETSANLESVVAFRSKRPKRKAGKNAIVSRKKYKCMDT